MPRPANQLDFPHFSPRWPWLGGDLQTLRNTMVGGLGALRPAGGRLLVLPLPDGDALVGRLQQPARPVPRKPLVVVIHGMGGDDSSAYVRASARALLEAGYPTVRLNLRGAGASRPHCRHRYHAGRSDDLRAALEGLPEELTREGVLLMGYSLGANMLLKLLAEGAGGLVRGAVSVSAPIDLQAAARRMLDRRNLPYSRYLLHRLKREALDGAAITPAQRQAVYEARSIYEFDQVFTAPRNGFRDADDYYTRNMALRFLPEVTLPTLVIHALDDPWIPRDAYESFAWQRHPQLVPLLAPSGGHVGFHAQGDRIPWHDRCALIFFERLRD